MTKKNIAISFENISKMYRLGLVGTGTLGQDLNRWWKMNILHQDDPYLKIGQTNDRTTKGTSDFVYALKDITFDVEQGDVVGIIGKNGAGKSTLLKLLSRITAPTTGQIKTRGRLASLLEVGTGFHPELTGRENIYMNGSIMGMTKAEITRKLDEIIDFAGVERYIDTPCKRYSSGMQVRLGFAVAAYLEPEILVVDEVLAVGDAEFQKKAIGKMQDVSRGGGRTVLFVSHNMDSMLNLCNHGILLENGMVKYSGDIKSTVSEYLSGNVNDFKYESNLDKNIYIKKAYFVGNGEKQRGMFSFSESVTFSIELKRNCIEFDEKTTLSVYIMTGNKTRVNYSEVNICELKNKDTITVSFSFPSNILMPGKYILHGYVHLPNVESYHQDDLMAFTIYDNGTDTLKYGRNDLGLVMLSPRIVKT